MTTIADLAAALKSEDYSELLDIARRAPLLAVCVQKNPLLVLEALDMVSVAQVEKRLRSMILPDENEEPEDSVESKYDVRICKGHRTRKRLRVEDVF
jgi:hypothetical protein